MRKFINAILSFLIVTLVMLNLSACNSYQKKYSYTTKRPMDTCVPTATYGCDLYTANIKSIKKMSGTMYKGGDFGKLDSEKKAFNAAITVILDIYGKKALEGFEPFVVTENTRADCWIVHGTPKDNLNTGMSFVALRKSTGEVVMVLKNPG
ncbi:MAG: NTF2 fold immunity protein [Bacillota bacterium]|nr:NTF2 fold immunity protein [Bacillota bacterium]